MSDLLDTAITAHGGLERWNEITSVTAQLGLGGLTWGIKGWDDALDDTVVTVDPHREHASFGPFTAPELRSDFTPSRVAILDEAGHILQERDHPRAAFAGHTMQTPWDVLHLAYFTGYALWTYLTMPFTLAEPGFETRELDPWQENGETWRRLWARFPAELESHSAEQVFYFGPDGLLRRHDYTAEVLGAPGSAHYTDRYRTFDGIVFPTQRRVVPRLDDNRSLPEPVLVSIDITGVTLTSDAPPAASDAEHTMTAGAR